MMICVPPEKKKNSFDFAIFCLSMHSLIHGVPSSSHSCIFGVCLVSLLWRGGGGGNKDAFLDLFSVAARGLMSSMYSDMGRDMGGLKGGVPQKRSWFEKKNKFKR